MTRSIWTIAPRPAAGSTRERLLDAGAMLFYENGFHAVGLDQILEEVGVTKTTFYNHFESKDELIVAVLNDRDERDMAALEADLLRRGGTARDRILSVFDVLDEWFCDPSFKGCLFINAAAQFPNQNDPVHLAAAHHAENVGLMMETLSRDAGAMDAPMLAKQLCMLVAAAITGRQVGGDPDAARVARTMASALLDRFIGPG